jgi:hypothetical protein
MQWVVSMVQMSDPTSAIVIWFWSFRQHVLYASEGHHEKREVAHTSSFIVLVSISHQGIRLHVSTLTVVCPVSFL